MGKIKRQTRMEKEEKMLMGLVRPIVRYWNSKSKKHCHRTSDYGCVFNCFLDENRKEQHSHIVRMSFYEGKGPYRPETKLKLPIIRLMDDTYEDDYRDLMVADPNFIEEAKKAVDEIFINNERKRGIDPVPTKKCWVKLTEQFNSGDGSSEFYEYDPKDCSLVDWIENTVGWISESKHYHFDSYRGHQYEILERPPKKIIEEKLDRAKRRFKDAKNDIKRFEFILKKEYGKE